MDATSYKERNKAMSKWIDFSLDERKAILQEKSFEVIIALIALIKIVILWHGLTNI